MSAGADFSIYTDPSALPTPDSTLGRSFDEASLAAVESKYEQAGSVKNLMDSIEHEDMSLPRSPTMTHQSEDVISEMPEDSVIQTISLDERSGQYAPYKQRSPFRSPSSVRALQMETPPPFNDFSSPKSYRHRLSTTSRHSTPRSIRSEGMTVRSKKTSSNNNNKKEFPLVLLHVTIMPIHFPYSQATMDAVLPPAIIDNYKVLRDKVSDTVLERGILLPHPRDEYELLEERLLESLELKAPRISKCGHFHYHNEGDSSDECNEEDEDEGFDSEGSNKTEKCGDCGQRVKDDRHGSGSHGRRWNIKIYAANGLMRAGAWTAAWREMERIDVEISPWVPEALRRKLDWRQEREDAGVSRDAGSLANGEDKFLEKDGEQSEYVFHDQSFLDDDGEQRDTSFPSMQPVGMSNDDELDMTYQNGDHRRPPSMTPHAMSEFDAAEGSFRAASSSGIDMGANISVRGTPTPTPGPFAISPEGLATQRSKSAGHIPLDQLTEQIPSSPRPRSRRSPHHDEIPLATLLRNYIYVLARDRRNVAIAILTLLVLILALRSAPGVTVMPATSIPAMPSMPSVPLEVHNEQARQGQGYPGESRFPGTVPSPKPAVSHDNTNDYEEPFSSSTGEHVTRPRSSHEPAKLSRQGHDDPYVAVHEAEPQSESLRPKKGQLKPVKRTKNTPAHGEAVTQDLSPGAPQTDDSAAHAKLPIAPAPAAAAAAAAASIPSEPPAAAFPAPVAAGVGAAPADVSYPLDAEEDDDEHGNDNDTDTERDSYTAHPDPLP
ncbi:hypothetical protein L228DRAFT_266445 [Xylona heveae TC161]|uniref:Uncharacterized protein n=1 Tax=Xylona heveae (strain CBS 132557 / TC161) TaxID=1328760 RepID=A0A165HY21_XYLHT|nr:hypothetical protein L228DRAFT_266445 [Xylona heveae TC161]KZF24084.1 hypothetical protein L228DRAFT_266445 [Xylona heveae TC161]